MAIPRNLSNLAPGADSSGVLGVTKGGTGAATLTSNNVLLGNGASAVQFVAPGTNGNVLTSNGTTWASTAPTTPALTLISTQTVSNAAIAEFTGITDTLLVVYFANVIASVTATNTFNCQFGNGSYTTSSYFYYTQTSTAASTFNSSTGASVSAGILSSLANFSAAYANGFFNIYNTTSNCSVSGVTSFGAPLPSSVSNVSNRNIGAKIDRIKFYFGGANISGTFSLYKLAQ